MYSSFKYAHDVCSGHQVESLFKPADVVILAFMPSFVVHVEVVRAMGLVWQNLSPV